MVDGRKVLKFDIRYFADCYNDESLVSKLDVARKVGMSRRTVNRYESICTDRGIHLIDRNTNPGLFTQKYFCDTDKLLSNEPITWWLIGFIYADGYLYEDRVVISQSKHDTFLIDNIKSEFNIENPVYEKLNVTGNHLKTIDFKSERFAERLKKLGATRNKSLTLKRPVILDRDSLICFIRGYIDGDGSVGRYKTGACENYLKLTVVGTRDMMEFFNETFSNTGNIYKTRSFYTVAWNGKKAEAVLDEIYKKDIGFQSRKEKIFKEG